VLTAAARALHREEPQPWVIGDYLAFGLAGPEGPALLGRLRAEVPRPYLLAFSRWVCVRARFPEDVVAHAAAALTSNDAQITATFAGLAAKMGEPFISRFLPAEMAQLLRRHGFGEITDFGPDEARAAYFAGRPDVEIAGAQRLIAATVPPACPPGEASVSRPA